jgi:hypothetical protein
LAEIFADNGPVNDDDVVPNLVAVEDPVLSATTATTAEAYRNEETSPLGSLTIPVLKQRLRDAGLPVSGNKAVLVARLLENAVE